MVKRASPKSGKLSKKDRTDPNAPKKPKTAYFDWLYNSGVRDEILNAHPDWTHKEKMSKVGKISGQKWGAMTDAEKQPWKDKSEAAKSKYKAEFEVYKKTDNYKTFTEELQKKKIMKNSGKKLKDPNKPKLPQSGYFRYLSDYRKQHPEMKSKVSESAKAAGVLWKAMSETEKKPYMDAAAKAKEEYKVTLEAYKKSPLGMEFAEKKKAFEAMKKAADDKLKGKKPKAKKKKKAKKATKGKGKKKKKAPVSSQSEGTEQTEESAGAMDSDGTEEE